MRREDLLPRRVRGNRRYGFRALGWLMDGSIDRREDADWLPICSDSDGSARAGSVGGRLATFVLRWIFPTPRPCPQRVVCVRHASRR